MKLQFLALSVVFSSSIGIAQSKKEQDIEAIKSLCGCYEIDFEYTETFAPDTNYVFHKDYKTQAGAEVAFVIAENENFISIQHLLVVSNGMIIKHWREDWVYENTNLLDFNKDMDWGYKKLSTSDAKGTWTQKVYQVDDSPRYEGYATWVHVDGRHFWHSKTDGPLPRREYSQRSDYNVLSRNNRIELTDYGWIHEQDNAKIVRGVGGDVELVQEKGFNTYRIIDDSKCEVAMKWWKENEAYWAVVREEWNKIYANNKGVNLQILIEDKALWEELFALGDQNKGSEMGKTKTVKEEVLSIIKKYKVG